MYTNPQNVRDLLGVDIDTADDEILEEFIEHAQRYVRTYIQIQVMDGQLSGDIDSANTTFSTQYAFWADTQGSLSISTLDFTVYGWAKDYEDDPFKRTELVPSTFDPIRGIVVLKTAPDKNVYGRITMDYSYYTKSINWDLLALVTAWKAAEIWVKREEYLVPESYAFGSKRVVQKRPWKFYEIEVKRLIDKIIALPMTKVVYERMVFSPRGTAGPKVNTTAAEEIKTEGSQYSPDPEIEAIVDNAEG